MHERMGLCSGHAFLTAQCALTPSDATQMGPTSENVPVSLFNKVDFPTEGNPAHWKTQKMCISHLMQPLFVKMMG